MPNISCRSEINGNRGIIFYQADFYLLEIIILTIMQCYEKLSDNESRLLFQCKIGFISDKQLHNLVPCSTRYQKKNNLSGRNTYFPHIVLRTSSKCLYIHVTLYVQLRKVVQQNRSIINKCRYVFFFLYSVVMSIRSMHYRYNRCLMCYEFHHVRSISAFLNIRAMINYGMQHQLIDIKRNIDSSVLMIF